MQIKTSGVVQPVANPEIDTLQVISDEEDKEAGKKEEPVV